MPVLVTVLYVLRCTLHPTTWLLQFITHGYTTPAVYVPTQLLPPLPAFVYYWFGYGSLVGWIRCGLRGLRYRTALRAVRTHMQFTTVGYHIPLVTGWFCLLHPLPPRFTHGLPRSTARGYTRSTRGYGSFATFFVRLLPSHFGWFGSFTTLPHCLRFWVTFTFTHVGCGSDGGSFGSRSAHAVGCICTAHGLLPRCCRGYVYTPFACPVLRGYYTPHAHLPLLVTHSLHRIYTRCYTGSVTVLCVYTHARGWFYRLHTYVYTGLHVYSLRLRRTVAVTRLGSTPAGYVLPFTGYRCSSRLLPCGWFAHYRLRVLYRTFGCRGLVAAHCRSRLVQFCLRYTLRTHGCTACTRYTDYRCHHVPVGFLPTTHAFAVTRLPRYAHTHVYLRLVVALRLRLPLVHTHRAFARFTVPAAGCLYRLPRVHGLGLVLHGLGWIQFVTWLPRGCTVTPRFTRGCTHVHHAFTRLHRTRVTFGARLLPVTTVTCYGWFIYTARFAVWFTVLHTLHVRYAPHCRTRLRLHFAGCGLVQLRRSLPVPVTVAVCPFGYTRLRLLRWLPFTVAVCCTVTPRLPFTGYRTFCVYGYGSLPHAYTTHVYRHGLRFTVLRFALFGYVPLVTGSTVAFYGLFTVTGLLRFTYTLPFLRLPPRAVGSHLPFYTHGWLVGCRLRTRGCQVGYARFVHTRSVRFCLRSAPHAARFYAVYAHVWFTFCGSFLPFYVHCGWVPVTRLPHTLRTHTPFVLRLLRLRMRIHTAVTTVWFTRFTRLRFVTFVLALHTGLLRTPAAVYGYRLYRGSPVHTRTVCHTCRLLLPLPHTLPVPTPGLVTVLPTFWLRFTVGYYAYSSVTRITRSLHSSFAVTTHVLVRSRIRLLYWLPHGYTHCRLPTWFLLLHGSHTFCGWFATCRSYTAHYVPVLRTGLPYRGLVLPRFVRILRTVLPVTAVTAAHIPRCRAARARLHTHGCGSVAGYTLLPLRFVGYIFCRSFAHVLVAALAFGSARFVYA